MRIVCPACTAAYDVPTDMFKPGQTVRCARCAREWAPEDEAKHDGVETSPAPATAAVSDPTPPPPISSPPISSPLVHEPAARVSEALVERATPTSRKPIGPPTRQASAQRLAWIASVAVLVALVWGAYGQRVAIMQAWPPSVRVYAALGFTETK